MKFMDLIVFFVYNGTTLLQKLSRHAVESNHCTFTGEGSETGPATELISLKLGKKPIIIITEGCHSTQRLPALTPSLKNL